MTILQAINIMILSVGFSLWFISGTSIPFKYKMLNRKPFNCEVCLPIYISAILICLPEIVSTYGNIAIWSAIITAWITNKYIS